MSVTKQFVPILAVLLATPFCVADDNWPTWRGPTGDGVAAESAKPPLEWSESKNVGFKVEIPGRGSSTPIIWGEDLFLLTAVAGEKKGDVGESPDETNRADRDRPGRGRPEGGRPEGGRFERRGGAEGAERPEGPGQPPGGRRDRGGRRGGGMSVSTDQVQKFTVLCLDRNTGETKWEKVVHEELPHEGHHGTNDFASASPVTDGEFLYASFGSRGLYKLKTSDGSLVWQKDLGEMNTRAGFGEGASPTLYEDKLFVTWDHEGPSFLTVLDAGTGEEIWRVERDEPTTWATPRVFVYKGRPQVVVHGMTVRSYDLEDGSLIWQCGGQGVNPIPTPLRFGDSVICITGYRDDAAFSVPLSSKGDVTGSDTLDWSTSRIGSYVSSPIIANGILYLTKSRNTILGGYDPATGKEIFAQARLPEDNMIYASPIAADGRLFYLERGGTTMVLEQTDKVNILAENKLDDTFNASPVAVGDKLYLRGEKYLYCLTEITE